METEETCDIVKRLFLKIKRCFNVINIEKKENKTFYILPIFKNNKISKYRLKKFANKVNFLMETEGTTTAVLSECLYNNQLFKNFLYSKNINILDGKFLFKCLTYKIIEYIFKVKNKEMKLRRSFISS